LPSHGREREKRQLDLWQDEAMPKKRKPKRFRAVEAVKAMARERIGTPPASQVIPDRRRTKKEKHKLTLEDLLDDAGREL
jgi:hypothetical protein